jgi:putative transcriptional regulator
MKAKNFDLLLKSLGQARAYAQGRPTSGTRVHMVKRVDVATIRGRTKLSQEAFALRIGVSVGTLRNWEQGRRTPDGPAKVLLALLERDPGIVERTLAKAA